MSATGDTFATAATVAGHPEVGALAKVVDSIVGLFGGRRLTSWEDQDAVIVPIAKQWDAELKARFSQVQLADFFDKAKAKFIELARGGGNGLHGPGVWENFSSATYATTNQYDLLWRALHWAFYLAPNFSDYEVRRRVSILLIDVFYPAASAAGIAWSVSGFGGSIAGQAGGGSTTDTGATSAGGGSTNNAIATQLSNALPYMLAGIALVAVVILARRK